MLAPGVKMGYEITVEDGIITNVGPAPSKGCKLGLRNRTWLYRRPHTRWANIWKSLIEGEPSQIWKRIWNPMEAALTPDSAYISAKWMFLNNAWGLYLSCKLQNQRDLNTAVHQQQKRPEFASYPAAL